MEAEVSETEHETQDESSGADREMIDVEPVEEIETTEQGTPTEED